MTPANCSKKNEHAQAVSEFPDISGFIECKMIKTKTGPTDRKTKTKVDMKHINSRDFASIRRQDRFMYYSIPEVRNDKLCMKKIGTSNASQYQMVTRSNCISFECHPDMILERYLCDDDSDLEEVAEDHVDLVMKTLGV